MADQFIYLCGLVRILVDAAEVGSEQLFCDHHLR